MLVILGGSESGTGAAILAKCKGLPVFVSDNSYIPEKYKKLLLDYSINFEENKHSIDKILSAELVIKSPGIPENSEIIRLIRKKQIPIISEIEFGSYYCNVPKLCITGSNGKTTTTIMLFEILKNANKNVGLAGNIGKSFSYSLATENKDIYVIEVSSFQLDDIKKFKPELAIITNITPDHLDRYDYKFENYIYSKFRITENQDTNNYFIYNFDDPVTKDYLSRHPIKAQKFNFSINEKNNVNCFVEDNKIKIIINQQKEEIMFIQELALQGKHNLYNSMAAAIAARLYDVTNEKIKECLAGLNHIEHRLEFVAKIHGIEFINDSKATNVNSTWYALECQTKPVIWIAGGQDKGNDYEPLRELVRKKVKAIVCLGKDNTKIMEFFAKDCPSIVSTSSMEQAVNCAYQLGKPGDVVLLSPACSSFDLFKNYEDRGNKFKYYVRQL